VPFITLELLPLISTKCHELLSDQQQPKFVMRAKITLPDFLEMVSEVHESLLLKLFGESEGETETYWLAHKLNAMFEQSKEFEAELLLELTRELLDIIETEYFQGALYELIQATFDHIFEGFLNVEILNKPEIFTDNSTYVIKLMTFISRAHSSGHVTHQLSR